MKTFMNIEQLSIEVAKNPALVQQIIEALYETNAFFEDPDAKKEDFVGTRQIVDQACVALNKVWNA